GAHSPSSHSALATSQYRSFPQTSFSTEDIPLSAQVNTVLPRQKSCFGVHSTVVPVDPVPLRSPSPSPDPLPPRSSPPKPSPSPPEPPVSSISSRGNAQCKTPQETTERHEIRNMRRESVLILEPPR